MISGQDMGVKTICLMRVSVQPIQRSGSWKVMTGSWKEASTHKIFILINIDNKYNKVIYMINKMIGEENLKYFLCEMFILKLSPEGFLHAPLPLLEIPGSTPDFRSALESEYKC